MGVKLGLHVESMQRQRRVGPAEEELKNWSAQGNEKTEAYAQKIFEGFKKFGGREVAEEVMDMGVHLLG
jgi:hypothetical protein